MAPSYQIRAILLLTVIISNIQLNTAVFDPMESQEEIELLPNCFRRGYTVKVQQKDSEGRSCWDVITVSSCWGLCHSNEIPDWRFPFKRSYHPVCQPTAMLPRNVILRNCDPDVESGTELYVALDAVSCRCEACRKDSINCEGPHYDRRLPVRRSNL